MGIPLEMSDSVQITIRLAPSVLKDATRLIPVVSKKNGFPATRLEVLRAAIVLGLEEMKRTDAKEKRP